jgi:hypothetical protein
MWALGNAGSFARALHGQTARYHAAIDTAACAAVGAARHICGVKFGEGLLVCVVAPMKDDG